jgi:MFS family permease
LAIVEAARIARAQIAVLLAVGVFWGFFAAMVPAFKARIGASDSVMGLCLMLASVGAIIAMAAAPRAAQRFGRPLLPVAGLAMVAGASFPAMAGSVPAFAAAMFGVGLTMAFADIGANIRVAVLEARHRMHLQNLVHAMFSFAFAGSALATTFMRKAGWAPEEVLPFVAAALILLAFAADEGRGWTPAPRAEGASGERMPWGTVLIVAAILFAAFVSENANEAWSALHIERTLGAPPGEGGLGPAMLGLTMGLGRLSGQVATARLGDVRLIFWGSLVASAGLVTLALAPVREVAVAGVGIFGFGIAVMVPTANALLARLVPPSLAGVAISRAWMIGFAGFFLGPAMMGFISDLTNLRVSFLVVAGIVALSAPLVLSLRRRGA